MALKEANTSQTELAQMIEKSRAYISNITKGRYVPKVSELIKIAEYLKKPVGYFLGEDKPGLMHYVQKAKKWDKLVKLIETDIRKDLSDDVVAIPMLEHANIRNKSVQEIIDSRKNLKNYIYLSKHNLRKYYKYTKSLDDLLGLRIFIRDYPEFGIYLGDITVYEPVFNNDIGDDSGKLFGIIYKGDLCIKRVYKEGKKYYFEPLHSTPQLNKMTMHNKDLVIAGKIVFSIHTKLF
ncbi:helix-turn-helix domain-containing protein [Candidatus Peregrinibacteria bacterium]|nr:helix-turn-helix domain-containing protein [Candidatus Peregrinibacteria bacterium]